MGEVSRRDAFDLVRYIGLFLFGIWAVVECDGEVDVPPIMLVSLLVQCLGLAAELTTC